jgi:hypothetical protein
MRVVNGKVIQNMEVNETIDNKKDVIQTIDYTKKPYKRNVRRTRRRNRRFTPLQIFNM